MKNNYKKWIISFILVILSISFFYYFWTLVNYPVHKEIKYSIVKHPEFIPTTNTIKLSSAWFSNLISDFYWLDAVQYIWWNAIWAEYKKYLYVMLNLITDLNPYFTYPYQIWELLLPSTNERYENFSEEEQNKSSLEWLKLWLKWIEKTCNKDKVGLIKQEFDLKKLWTDKKYQDPCLEPMIPYYLAYIYYWNFFDGIKSAQYYKVTSANTTALSWSRIMVAIMQWKWWDRTKSIMMFLSLAESMWQEKSETCINLSKELQILFLKMFQQNQELNWKILMQIESTRKNFLKESWESDIDQSKTNIENLCSNYINKAVREANLTYLEQADKKFFADKKAHAKSTQELFDKKYIDYFPRDFQKQEDNIEIIYFYNNKTWNWDYKMGNYEE